MYPDPPPPVVGISPPSGLRALSPVNFFHLPFRSHGRGGGRGWQMRGGERQGGGPPLRKPRPTAHPRAAQLLLRASGHSHWQAGQQAAICGRGDTYVRSRVPSRARALVLADAPLPPFSGPSDKGDTPGLLRRAPLPPLFPPSACTLRGGARWGARARAPYACRGRRPRAGRRPPPPPHQHAHWWGAPTARAVPGQLARGPLRRRLRPARWRGAVPPLSPRCGGRGKRRPWGVKGRPTSPAAAVAAYPSHRCSPPTCDSTSLYSPAPPFAVASPPPRLASLCPGRCCGACHESGHSYRHGRYCVDDWRRRRRRLWWWW